MIRTILGTNRYSVLSETNRIIAEFKIEHGDSVERFDGRELQSADDVLNAVRSISFLEPRKLVLVSEFSQSKELLDALEDIVNQTADSTELVLTDGKLDKRLSTYKFLKKHTEFVELNELGEPQLISWLCTRAEELGAMINPQQAQFLIRRVGLSQLQLEQEIQKLAIIGGEITQKNIIDLVQQTPQSKVFDLLDTLFRGDLQKTLELYEDQRSQGEEPQKIIGMIVWQLQQLTLAVYAPEKSVSTLTAAGMSPYSAQKALDLARRISRQDLAFYVSELAKLDAQSKTSADVESTLAVYFSEVAVRQQQKG